MKAPRPVLPSLAAGTLLVGIVVSAGCDAPQPKQPFIEQMIEDRAQNLDRSTRRTIARTLIRAESRFGVDAFLLLAVVEHESHFRVDAGSRKGARGLMQIRPGTAEAVAERHGMPWRGPEDLHDPEICLPIGAAYLAELEDSFGSWKLALAAYLRGPTRLRRGLERGPVQSRYADRVLQRYERFRDLWARSDG